MRTPTDLELEHIAVGYNPVQAHEYYMRTRKLKGRRKGSSAPSSGLALRPTQASNTKAKQKKELQAHIQDLSQKLTKLEALIREKEHAAAAENRKSKAKKERSAKEKDKPKSAAEKAKAARENKKFRDKHKQELKTKAKSASKSGGGKSSGTTASKSSSVTELKALATKVRGQIAVAKQKLAAL